MSSLSDALTAWTEAMRKGDTVTAHELMTELMFAMNIPEDRWGDVMFLTSWSWQSGFMAGLEVARQSISASAQARRDTSASSPEARILRDLEDDG